MSRKHSVPIYYSLNRFAHFHASASAWGESTGDGEDGAVGPAASGKGGSANGPVRGGGGGGPPESRTVAVEAVDSARLGRRVRSQLGWIDGTPKARGTPVSGAHMVRYLLCWAHRVRCLICPAQHSRGNGLPQRPPEVLVMENEALRAKIASFEQQHRFMMSALDREDHLKVKEQERQRIVLRAELDDVLKQLRFNQFECEDKLKVAAARCKLSKVLCSDFYIVILLGH